MAVTSSGTRLNSPRRKRFSEMPRKKRSTLFSHDAEVGAHDVFQFLDELWVARDLEAAQDVRLQTVGLPVPHDGAGAYVQHCGCCRSRSQRHSNTRTLERTARASLVNSASCASFNSKTGATQKPGQLEIFRSHANRCGSLAILDEFKFLQELNTTLGRRCGWARSITHTACGWARSITHTTSFYHPHWLRYITHEKVDFLQSEQRLVKP